jgi:mannosyltransferase
VTVGGDTRARAPTARPDGHGTGIPAGRTALDDLADRAAKVAWCWPALLTLALGVYQMGRPELWRDELASWSFATRPVPSLIAAARHSGATQLVYYLVLHVWITAFGDSADAMRTLSVLTMAAAAACVALLGQRLAGARAGLLAGLVFALVPSVSRFAQEVRFYAFEVLVATLATLLLMRALDRPSAPRWAVYGLSLAILGYIDLVALSVVVGHAGAVALRWWQDRDRNVGLLGFIPAAALGLAACLPLLVIGAIQAGGQVEWIPRPGVDLYAFTSFARNLFFSTSVAAALILLAVSAWAAAWREAAFMTAIAVLPVAAVWLVSQGPHSYFWPRYLLLTVGAWAVLAGLALSRLDLRIAAACVCVVAIFGAGDQQVIREPGAHNWASYPVGTGVSYLGYAEAAAVVARQARAGDGAVYQGDGTPAAWLMIGYGVQYYLRQVGVPPPHQLFIAGTPAKAGVLYPRACKHDAACLGNEPRIWVVGYGHEKSPYQAVTAAQAALLRSRYRLSYLKHVPGLTVFLLTRAPAPPPA